MNAVRYFVETCVVDSDDDVHVILVNEQRGTFVPIYIELKHCSSIVRVLQGDEANEDELTWSFVMGSWVKLGFKPISIVLDHQGDQGVLIPCLTFLQNQADRSFIYVTTIVPMGSAVTVSALMDIPLYITERAESVVKRIELSKLNDYIEQVSVKESE